MAQPAARPEPRQQVALYTPTRGAEFTYARSPLLHRLLLTGGLILAGWAVTYTCARVLKWDSERKFQVMMAGIAGGTILGVALGAGLLPSEYPLPAEERIKRLARELAGMADSSAEGNARFLWADSSGLKAITRTNEPSAYEHGTILLCDIKGQIVPAVIAAQGQLEWYGLASQPIPDWVTRAYRQLHPDGDLNVIQPFAAIDMKPFPEWPEYIIRTRLHTRAVLSYYNDLCPTARGLAGQLTAIADAARPDARPRMIWIDSTGHCPITRTNEPAVSQGTLLLCQMGDQVVPAYVRPFAAGEAPHVEWYGLPSQAIPEYFRTALQQLFPQQQPVMVTPFLQLPHTPSLDWTRYVIDTRLRKPTVLCLDDVYRRLVQSWQAQLSPPWQGGQFSRVWPFPQDVNSYYWSPRFEQLDTPTPRIRVTADAFWAGAAPQQPAPYHEEYWVPRYRWDVELQRLLVATPYFGEMPRVTMTLPPDARIKAPDTLSRALINTLHKPEDPKQAELRLPDVTITPYQPPQPRVVTPPTRPPATS